MSGSLKWVTLNSADQSDLPKIKNQSTTFYKDKIYIFGGYDGDSNQKSLISYDVATRTNTQLQSKGISPSARNGHTTTLVGNEMFLIGGWLGSAPLAARDIFVLNLDSMEWREVQPDGDPMVPCNMHTADLLEDTIYVFRGGDGKSYMNDLFRLSTRAMVWEALRPTGDAPSIRANHSSSLYGQQLFIFGGWNGFNRLNDMHMYHTQNSSWSEITPSGEIPTRRAGMSLNLVCGELYLFGGSGSTYRGYNDVHVFDPNTLQWRKPAFREDSITPLPRAGHSTCTFNNKIYVYGGNQGNNFFGDVLLLDIDPEPKVIQAEVNDENELLLGTRNMLKNLLNDVSFSDVVFVVEGKRIYARKAILSILSEKFRAMFAPGILENRAKEIVVDDVSYPVFYVIMEYLYTGKVQFGGGTEGQPVSTEFLCEILFAADRYLLEAVKTATQVALRDRVNQENIFEIEEMAQRTNATALRLYCQWVKRQVPNRQ